MESPTRLQYQTSIVVAGLQLACVESYDSLFERMRSAHIGLGNNSNEMALAEPIELTVQGPEGRPLRAAVSPHALACVVETHPADRVEVAVSE